MCRDYGINTDEMLLQYAEVLLSGGIQDANSKLYKLLMQHQNQIPALQQGICFILYQIIFFL